MPISISVQARRILSRDHSTERHRTGDMDLNATTSTGEVDSQFVDDDCAPGSAPKGAIGCPPMRDKVCSFASPGWNWRPVPLHKQAFLWLFFIAAFLILDGSSTASQRWEGAPPLYLPVGLSLAVLLCGGWRFVPAVLAASVVAAVVNYHRPIFSWCGLPGSVAIYFGYIGAATSLRRRRRFDAKVWTPTDVGRYIAAGLGGAVSSAGFGVLTLLGDGRIRQSEILRAMADWWVSDVLAIITFSPLLLFYIAPVVDRWLKGRRVRHPMPRRTWWPKNSSIAEILEGLAQSGCVVFAIWFVFEYAPARSYQPLYLLFVPVIWVAVRRGLAGAVLINFAISTGMTFTAWITQAQRGSLPRLQLAMLALGLTGLCLGAVVTERKRVEETIRQSEKRYRLLFERNLAGVFRSTLAGRILECNPAAARLFGHDSPEEVMAFPAAHSYFEPSDREEFLKRINFEKNITNYEMRFRRKNGDSAWAMLNASLVDDLVEGTLVDITERRIAEQRVQSLAYSDGLTGLPNRVVLWDRLSQALKSARRQNQKLAVLFLDLDRFKIINDSLGHSVGDLLLQEVGKRLQRIARDQDTAARLGGDEFVIVLSNIKDVYAAASAAERFMDAMTVEFVIQDHSINLGCSVGISMFPEHGADCETLIKNADAAMYSAKTNGRNNFRFFSEGMNAQVVERLSLENGLRVALEKNELFLVYQPQMNIATGEMTGLEALLRWQNPRIGLVSPNKFIQIAENSGLIIPIGEWVLRTACSQAVAWQHAGLPAVTFAVNVSAVQFRRPHFCKFVQSVLAETGLAPQQLELELTESLLLGEADTTLSVIN